MPVKTTALAPFSHPTTGEPVAAGAEVTLSDEDYAALRTAGTVAASAAEQKEHVTQDAEGNFAARTTREDAGGKAEEPKADDSKEKRK